MNIKDNPFYVLNISNQTSADKIQETCNTNMLLYQDEKYDSYQTILFNSNTRLEAEINWFPGIDEKTLNEVIGNKNSNIYLNSISKINICRYRLVKSKIDALECQSIISILSDLVSNELHTKGEYFYNIINNDRSVAGFEKINGQEKVEEQIDRLVASVLNEIPQYLNTFTDDEKLTFITAIVEKNNKKVNNVFEYSLIEKKIYENYIISFEDRIKNIKNDALEAIYFLINNPNSIMDRIIEKTKHIASKLNVWHSYARPMILFQIQTEGEDYAGKLIEEYVESIPRLLGVLKRANDKEDFLTIMVSFEKIIEDFPSIQESYKEYKNREARGFISQNNNVTQVQSNNSNFHNSYRNTNTKNTANNNYYGPNPKINDQTKTKDWKGFAFGCFGILFWIFVIVGSIMSCSSSVTTYNPDVSSKTSNKSKTSSTKSTTNNLTGKNNKTSSSNSSSNYSYLSNLEDEISDLKSEIDDQEWRLNRLQDEIDDKKRDMEDAYDEYMDTGDDYYYFEYEDLYDECEDLIDDYNRLYRDYSDNIDDYNDKVNTYNNY